MAHSVYCVYVYLLFDISFAAVSNFNDHSLLIVVIPVDSGEGHIPSSHSFDNSIQSRPDILSVNASIPEETAVEIADTSYAPLVSPDEQPERLIASTNVETVPQDLDSQLVELRQKLDERRVGGGMGDTDGMKCDRDLLPNGKGVQHASSVGNKPTAASRLQSVLLAVGAILICTLIGAIVMFELDGTVPLSTSLHALTGTGHFRRKVYCPMSTAVGRSLAS